MGQDKNGITPETPDYRYITTPEALAQFVAQAADAKMMAVDLEADSMFHYREKVCLLQIAADGLIVVIDPLRVGDLSPLRPLFADPKCCKVFHGADYDVRSLYRDFGIVINNLFDTQIASMFLGERETGLESVVGRRFGVELNKKYQKKDWSRRPLPDDMIAYAALDVVFLTPLALTVMTELERKYRLEWVRQECELLSRVRPAEENGAPLFMRIKGAGRLPARQLAVLEALLHLRDEAARIKDRPHFKIISNVALLKIATALPTGIKGLQHCDALSERQIEMYGMQICRAIEVALAIPADRLSAYPRQKSPRMSPRVPLRLKALRTLRDRLAETMNLDPALLFSRALMRDIAIHKPRTVEELSAIPGMHAWQVQCFGSEIVDTLHRFGGE